MSNRPNPVNHAMLMGIEVGVWFALNFIVGAQQLQHPSLWLLSWMITLYVGYGVYRAAQHYKRFECADKITFGQAYSYIMWLFLCASLVAAVLRFAYLQWMDTDYLPKMYETVAAAFEGHPELFNGIDKEEFLLSMQSLLSPIRFAVNYSMCDMIFGALFGLVLSPVVVHVKARFVFPFGGNPDKKDDDTDSEN